MKKIVLLSVVIGCCVGCTTTQQGALYGGAGGAGLGAIIGHQSGHTGEGALIGGAVGALGGALVGDHMNSTKQNQPLDKTTKRGYYKEIEVESEPILVQPPNKKYKVWIEE